MSGTGVFEIFPKSADGAVYRYLGWVCWGGFVAYSSINHRETLDMGEIQMHPRDLSSLISQMKQEYQGLDYHALHKYDYYRSVNASVPEHYFCGLETVIIFLRTCANDSLAKNRLVGSIGWRGWAAL